MLAWSWESKFWSHACFVTNPKNLLATILYHIKGQSLLFFCHPTAVSGQRTLPPKMCDQNGPRPCWLGAELCQLSLQSWKKHFCSHRILPNTFGYWHILAFAGTFQPFSSHWCDHKLARPAVQLLSFVSVCCLSACCL